MITVAWCGKCEKETDTFGLFIEKVKKDEEEGFFWFCEKCGNMLYEEKLVVNDIVKQLPPVMEGFYSDEQKRTCNKCGAVMPVSYTHLTLPKSDLV